LESGGRSYQIENLTIKNVSGNPTSRRDLERLPLEDYNCILILADQDFEQGAASSHDMIHADSRSLTSLLLIRDIQQKRNVQTHIKGRLSIFDANFSTETRRTSSPVDERMSNKYLPIPLSVFDEPEDVPEESPIAVISEILDVRTKPLIAVASVTDYVTSNELVRVTLCPTSPLFSSC
jgi:hypothetical protein